MEEIKSYDDWKLAEPPELKTIDQCYFCGGEIYEGDEVYELKYGHNLIHTDCFRTYAIEELTTGWLIAGERMEAMVLD